MPPSMRGSWRSRISAEDRLVEACRYLIRARRRTESIERAVIDAMIDKEQPD
jgi:hypothetical protein